MSPSSMTTKTLPFVLGRLLRAADIQPVTYPSAEAFLADTKRPQFDCLVLDIQLGGMSGIQLSQQLLAEGLAQRPSFSSPRTMTPKLAPKLKPRAAAPISERPTRALRCSMPSADACVTGGPRLELTSYDGSKDANIGTETLEEHVTEQKIVLTGVARVERKGRRRSGGEPPADGVGVQPRRQRGRHRPGARRRPPGQKHHWQGRGLSHGDGLHHRRHQPVPTSARSRITALRPSSARKSTISTSAEPSPAESPAIDGLDQDPIATIKTGDWVEIDAPKVGQKATVTITRKVQSAVEAA